jgi:signal transduction histidine kinase
MLDGAEQARREERRRFAREVHDGISQQAFMLAVRLETVLALRDTDGKRTREMLRPLVGLAHSMLAESRALLTGLDGRQVWDTTIGELLQRQIDDFAEITGIRSSLSRTGTEPKLPRLVVRTLFRAVQEALSNLYRHAQASEAAIRLEFGEGCVLISVTDNGIGYHPSHGALGHGLSILRDRLDELGGVLHITNVPGSGTTVRIIVPIGGGRFGVADSGPAGR